MSTRTCPGHCCVAFYLESRHDRVDEIRTELVDGDQIADMVIPLSVAEANARLERFGADREYGRDSEGFVYTCRHFDDATRLCRIYADRPEMCREYPYARGCEFECDYCASPEVVAKWKRITSRGTRGTSHTATSERRSARARATS